MDSLNILLVEDDHDVMDFLQRSLKEQGYSVAVALDGQMALGYIKQNSYDLILLDVMLPKINGHDVLKEIRTINKDVAVIMLTALGNTENVVSGLEGGADDYVVKPFKFHELHARMNAVMRRKTSVTPSSNVVTFQDIKLNDQSKTVTRAGKRIDLTATEYKLLKCFIQNANRVLTRDQLLQKVWGIDFDLSTNVVDVYVNYLRRKIEKPELETVIHTVFGMGYVLRSDSK